MQDKKRIKFKAISFPGVIEKTWIPKDIDLQLPTFTNLPKRQQHFLIYIPWKNKYLNLVPKAYRNFFEYVLPFLGARTTNIHTAISLSYFDELLSDFKQVNINKKVVAIALILHDCGWNNLSDKEIAKSLGVTGLKLTKSAVSPKEKHAVEGKEIALKILNEYKFLPQLTESERILILDCILYHDKPDELIANYTKIPIEMKILADLDHVWSFTFENFWQDTVRKGVKPKDYLINLTKDMHAYFITRQGKKLAKKLLIQRSDELKIYNDYHSD